MKNVRFNKISIILEFLQYHYVAIFFAFSFSRASYRYTIFIKFWFAFLKTYMYSIPNVPSFIGTHFFKNRALFFRMFSRRAILNSRQEYFQVALGADR